MRHARSSAPDGGEKSADRESRDAAGTGATVLVLLPLPLRSGYDYLPPDDEELAPGDIVRVPLGNRIETGVVWGAGRGDVAPEKLKRVAERVDVPPMTEPMRRFVDWVAGYTLASPGSVLRMCMPIPEALEPPRPLTVYHAAAVQPDGLRMTEARTRVLDLLGAAEDGGWTAADLAREAGVSAGVVKGLAESGALVPATVVEEPASSDPDPAFAPPTLSPAQAEAATEMCRAVGGRKFVPFLLEGVTGSGKTEVYFEAIAAALRAGRQALVLLPEIALGAQWLDRFRDRFGVAPVLWHSDVKRPERRRAWRAVATGRAQVVVGARSALFLPFPDLGLIVVDEEHDSSYKQEDGVVYHARDMAVVRASLSDCPVVLASATPALETLANVEAGRYRRLHLPERHGGASLPAVELVDLRRTPPERGQWIARPLADAIAGTLAAGEQAMLFLNRRGYAPLTLCRACGHRLECPNCTAWLVEHRLSGRLSCHHCGYSTPVPEACPECGAADSLVPCGPGVERLAEEVADRYPDARLAIMSSDTVHGPAQAEALIQMVRAHEVDLLIGTQIMAKGHHFPMLTLVGVVDADLGLSGGDLRAAERTWQMLNQVAGRAGRADRPGRVLLQTYMPDTPVLQALAAGDGEAFLEAEFAARERQKMPPFGRLAALIVADRHAARAEDVARALARAAPRQDGVQVLGPAPAPLAVLRGLHRYRLLVKAEKGVNLQALLRRWLGSVRRPSSVRVKVDIDPYSFL